MNKNDDMGFVSNKIIILISIFIGGLIIAAPLAVKMIGIGFNTYVTAGVLAYSITFPVTDIIGEVYGKKAAQQVVRGGFFALIIAFALIQASIHWTPAPFWEGEAAFMEVMNSSMRIIIASIIAYTISQTFDVWFFGKLKTKTKGRFLWIRNNCSTIVSQAIDTFVWTGVALYGVLEAQELQQIFFGEWGAKIAIAALDTPLVYLGVYWLRKKKNPVEIQSCENVAE